MKQGIFTVEKNEKLCDGIFKMILTGDVSDKIKPGQFINIKIDGLFLRRPISVCDFTDNNVTVIYKTVGTGTENMSNMSAGQKLDILTELGNGYNTCKSGKYPLLIGGGVGIPPLYALCKSLVNEGKEPSLILGFNTASEIFYVDEFKTLTPSVFVTTADGTYGKKGFVTDEMVNLNYTYFYTCGPMAMFRAIEKIAKTSGQYSFEERMGCGFGVCMGCSIQTKYGTKRVCKEGPVFEREEIIW